MYAYMFMYVYMYVYMYVCSINNVFVWYTRSGNWMPILTALSEEADYVIAEVEAEIARDLSCLLGQGDGSGAMDAASTCYPYRRLLYYVITLSSVTSKVVQLARFTKGKISGFVEELTSSTYTYILEDFFNFF